ncbi:hypothetical protein AKO1_014811 [Acrasis kona]|uniref:Fungal lipase-type domain-containing protein n=1 Tax=Acrasis kona TaxID=1008807 RepID=A0AAW2Z1B2_9EUKA
MDNNSILKLLHHSAESMKRALPTYSELTVGDITVGLASLVVEHKKQHVSSNLNANPILYKQDNKKDDDFIQFEHNMNPDKIDARKFLLAQKLLPYANMVYYPIVIHETQHFVLMESLDTSLKCATSITKNKDHKHLRAHPFQGCVQSVCVSEHMKQAFFLSLDHDLNAIIISVRGTDSVADVFTNFTAAPKTLELHKFYELGDEEHVVGIVHGGKLDSARWILTQIQDKLDEILLSDEPSYRRFDTVITVGHSLGGAVATLLSFLLREYFLEKCNLNQMRLPCVRCLTFSSSAFLSKNLSLWCRDFVDTFIIGMDIVPRFSVGQADRLRIEIAKSKYQNALDKYFQEHQIIAKLIEWFNKLLSEKGHNPVVMYSNILKTSTKFEPQHVEQLPNDPSVDTLYPPGYLIWFCCEKRVLPDKDAFKLMFEYVQQFVSKGQEEDSEQEAIKISQIIYKLINGPKKKKEKKNRKFVARRVDPTHFDRIVLTRKMFTDHKLTKYFNMLDKCVNQLSGRVCLFNDRQVCIIENYFNINENKAALDQSEIIEVAAVEEQVKEVPVDDIPVSDTESREIHVDADNPNVNVTIVRRSRANAKRITLSADGILSEDINTSRQVDVVSDVNTNPSRECA